MVFFAIIDPPISLSLKTCLSLMISALSTYRLSFTGPKEANIIETGEAGSNSVKGPWEKSYVRLIDGEGLAGTTPDMPKCGVSIKGSTPRAFFYMKLAKPSTVMKLQLARRTSKGYEYQGKNVRIQVGTSPKYNANDPVCTEIAQLSGTGLVDYHCNQNQTGQYVIISNDQKILTICEAKVFVKEDSAEANIIETGTNSAGGPWDLSPWVNT